MIIDCVSDFHGHYPKLEGGDLLIVAGDLTAADRPAQYDSFSLWLVKQNYKKKIIVPGNHDGFLEKGSWLQPTRFFDYLCDSGTEFEGLKIWGSPWTLSFEGLNPHCAAFTGTEELLEAKFALIPDDIDILVTHGPPFGILDRTIRDQHVGSQSLEFTIDRIKPELVIFGHIHECGGKYVEEEGILYINGSIVDEKYRRINSGTRVIFDEKMPKMQRFKVFK